MTPPTFRRSLCIGTTGMLAGALGFVVDRSAQTFVAARQATAFLAARSHLNATAIDLNWTRTGDAQTTLGPIIGAGIDLACLWIHPSGGELLQWILSKVMLQDCLVVHVLSSTAPDPSAFRDALDRAAARCRYRTVRLGAVRLPDGSRRWLTDEEISNGAIRAIERAADVTVGSIPGS